jgi:hypothetical protein
MSDKTLTNAELELTQRIQLHFPRGKISQDVLSAWCSCYKYDLTRRLTEVFGIMPESVLQSKSTGVFDIVCKGSHTASELVRRGKYDWVNNWITDEHFPIVEHIPQNRRIELISFGYDPDSEAVFREFSRKGLERPTYEDVFYFGIQNPEEQKRHSIVFLHEPVVSSGGGRYVLVLYGISSRRDLGFNWFDDRWSRGFVFAGVRR